MFDFFRTKPVKPDFKGIIEYAKQEAEEAMDIFVSAKNRLILANETIEETQMEVKEALEDLKKTSDLLDENKAFNNKLIGNITKIIE